MLKPEIIIKRAERLMGNEFPKKDCDLLVRLVTQRRLTHIYGIMCALDDICNGKNADALKRHKYLSLLLLSYAGGGVMQLSGKMVETLTQKLRTDLQLHPLKRVFSANKLETIPPLRSLKDVFRFVAALSQWHDKDDFVEDVDILGALLENGKVVSQAVSLVSSEKISAEQLREYRLGLLYLRELATVYSVTGIGKQLPSVSEVSAEKDVKEVFQAVKRFAVDEQVRGFLDSAVEEIKQVVGDIEDILRDYPRSTFRTMALKRLKTESLQYIAPKIKE